VWFRDRVSGATFRIVDFDPLLAYSTDPQQCERWHLALLERMRCSRSALPTSDALGEGGVSKSASRFGDTGATFSIVWQGVDCNLAANWTMQKVAPQTSKREARRSFGEHPASAGRAGIVSVRVSVSNSIEHLHLTSIFDDINC